MSPLLYHVACRIDGSRGSDTIAELVSAGVGRSLDAEQVRYLITARLLPLGVVAAGGVPRALPKANPLFALRARGMLLPEGIVNLVGAFLRPLFRWPVVVVVASSMLAVDWWLFAVHGLGGGIQQVLRDPVDLLVVLGLSLVSALFHECGHAAVGRRRLLPPRRRSGQRRCRPRLAAQWRLRRASCGRCGRRRGPRPCRRPAGKTWR